MKHKLLSLSLLLALSLTAWAQTDEFNSLLEKAQKGDTAAQFAVGYKYATGQEVKQDYTQALYWFQKVAPKGHIKAQSWLGEMYQYGKGVTKDYAKAVKWYSKSAKKGYATAQCNLGYLYGKGWGVKQNYKKAVYWYRKAAEQGLDQAQNNLGYEYERGYGVDKRDYVQAVYWYRKAADQGLAQAQYNLGKMYMKGGYGLEEDYDQAIYWFRKAAEQGYQYAQYDLAERYYWGVNKDYVEAAKWYKKAAEQGHMKAQYMLGMIYNYGRDGVPCDYAEAAKWYKKAADQGDKDAKESYAKVQKRLNDQKTLAQRSTAQSTSQPTSQPKPQPAPTPVVVASLVDINIPTTNAKNENTFVIIIANEDYKNVAKVPFALNDGRILAKYCQQTLGIPASHIKLHENATYNDIRLALAWLKNVCDKYEGEASVIFYYTGHGIPDESDKSAYLLPVDGDGRYVATGYKMDDLYQRLGAMPTKSITVLLDACFSGATRDGKMVAQAKGVALKVKKGQPKGNTVVIAAAQGDETAGFDEEEGHGMFTYYLLKKLQDTQGNVTLQELSQYIIREVGRKSAVSSKPQTPCVTPSASLGTSWQSWTLK